jgi:hypothetical protein
MGVSEEQNPFESIDMFKDLKQSIEQVIFDATVLDCPLSDDFVVVSRESLEALENEFKVCFVEPEDDPEYQDYSSPWERGE